jgi:Zn-dependent metalloprotease
MVEAIRMRGSPALRKRIAALGDLAERARTRREAARPRRALEAKAPAPPHKPKPDRRVYDGQNRAALPGLRARFEGDPRSDDRVVNQAYVGAGDVFKLYQEAFGRDSIDGQGMRIVSTVHHRRDYNNAYWDGEQMVYGDGDGELFLPFTGSLSVIGHELSHGVVQHSGGLVYQGQSGALNESLADVFGALTVQRKRKQTAAEANWLIGDGILAAGVRGVALRSLKAPGTAYDDPILGKDPQPYHRDYYVDTQSDHGGVHINSGIPNHAFYLFAQFLGGYAWERAGLVWYRALRDISHPHATFVDWAEQTLAAARAEFGEGSLEALYCKRSWKLVGIVV